ncbi:peptidoglycan/LPS O-acetylase OafA/YrhL [Blastococcus colisei]|uniref:Peptidoglycan/LPS O-acetylase OafA/YrhL n=1 Tax=Blastococcus colisei TaxID=1564162 RepID=A0A543PBN3_9ACTN|nr:acyltransferase [Blastococcus colisei]TQN41491.1 peptidoglycan/LPS O-acetylase OafA/YrhL [Blastococcus colisei]
MAGTSRPPRGEIRGLTGLRLVAALWVVAHHYWLFAPAQPWLRHLEPVRPLLESGWLGVDLFFVLSGFVLAHNYVTVLGSRPGVRAAVEFYWARLSRIWPIWMVVLGVVTAGLVVKQLGAVGAAESVSRIDAPTMLRQVLLVQVWDRPDYSATGPVGPGWSLSAEWLAYLFFPVVVLVLYRLRGCRATVLGALALAAVTPFVYGCLALGSHDWRWSWLVRLAGCFLAGALVSLCVHRIRATVPAGAAERVAAWAAGVAVATMVLVLWWADAVEEDHGGAAVLVFPLLVGALALTDGGPARLLSTPVVVLGGRISFALYLVHMAVFEVVWTVADVVASLGGGSAPATLLHVVGLALPLPVAWTLWRFVEEPARLRMRRIGPRPAGVAEPRASGGESRPPEEAGATVSALVGQTA